MRVLLVLILLLTLGVFLISHILHPAVVLHIGVSKKVESKDFFAARQQCERVLALEPCLFSEVALSRVGEVAIAAVQSELQKPDPDFLMARHWLSQLLERGGPPTGSEPMAKQIMEKMPELHFAHARGILLQKGYERALAEFAEMQRLYSGDPILERIKPDAYAAEIEYALALNETGDAEAALDRLAKLSHSTHLPPAIVSKALSSAPVVAEKAIRARIGRGDFPVAFDLMENLDSRFADPQTSSHLRSLRARLDLELFNIALESGHRRGAAIQPPVKQQPSGDVEKAVLLFRNETIAPMRIICTGPERVEIDLPINAERKVAVVPGIYLTAVYWPSNPSLRPKREQSVLQPGVLERHFGMQRSIESGLPVIQNIY